MNRYKATFTSFEDSESRSDISVVFSTSSGNVTIFHPQLEEGEDATAFDADSNEQTSQVKQTADEIKLAVGNTGVDITHGKILAKTNKFEIVNNSDVTTFSVDSTGSLQSANGASFKGSVQASAFEIYKNGNRTFYADNDGNLITEGEASFGGTIKAKNLYQGAFISPGGANNGEQIWYCNDYATFHGTDDDDSFITINEGESYINNFTEGKYYTTSEIQTLSNNEITDPTGLGFTPCTGYANVIYILPEGAGRTYSDICLPRPEDFPGKVIDVHPFYDSDSSQQTIDVYSVCGYAPLPNTQDRMVKGVYAVGGYAQVGGNTNTHVSIDTDKCIRFMSMYLCYSTNIYHWYWVALPFVS